MIAFGLKLMIQIIFQTLFLFMILWMILFHDRWENFRDFMTRNYSSDSLIYFCGFLILFAFLLTTLGRGFLFEAVFESGYLVPHADLEKFKISFCVLHWT